jgi:hypothetical protein
MMQASEAPESVLDGKHKAHACDLYFRVREEGHLYVADFYTEDGTFVADWAAEKVATTQAEFVEMCHIFAAVLLFREPGESSPFSRRSPS